MGYGDLKKTEGFESPGAIVPYMDPNLLIIVGLDVPETADNWFAHCARLADETDDDLKNYVEDMLRNGKADEPVDVYRDGHRLVVLDGRRTTRAARMARSRQLEQGVDPSNLIAVRVLIQRGTPDELHRINTDSFKHKPLTPMQFAKQVLHYYNHAKQDASKTATRFRVTPQHIRANILPLFDLDVSVQKAVDEGKLPVYVAVGLKDKPRAEQKTALTQLEDVGATKGTAAKNAIAAIKRGDKVIAKDKTKPRTPRQLGKWRESLAKVAETKNAAYGRMVEMIDFVLGKPPSEWMLQQFKGTLTEAGLLKEPKAPKAKREPKPKKEPKAPKAKKPAAKGKKGR